MFHVNVKKKGYLGGKKLSQLCVSCECKEKRILYIFLTRLWTKK